MSVSKSEIGKLQKILELEKKTGYQDTAVMGGLEGLLKKSLDTITAESKDVILSKISEYAQLEIPDRRSAIQEVQDILIGLEGHPSTKISPPSTEESVSIKAPQQSSSNLSLHDSVRFAKGAGEQRSKQLNKLGIESIGDLLLYLPRRLEDRSTIKKIGHVKADEFVTVQGRLRAIDIIKPRRNLQILKIAVQDNTGVIFATWFNQPWLKTQFAQGERISLYGQIEKNYGGLQMSNPVWEPVETNFLTGRLVPIYPVTKGLTPAQLYRLIRQNFEVHKSQITEILPEEIRERQELLPRVEAIQAIHFPESMAAFEQARRSMAFEEFLIFQIGVALERAELEEESAKKLAISDDELDELLEHLPFKLTGAQQRVIKEIRQDMASGHPMNRLLQGDVGSGKTVVAAAAAFAASKHDAQSALMAPTEILAHQHFENLLKLLTPLGIRLALLVGSLKAKERRQIEKLIALGEIDLVVGTHALISQGVEFKNLELAIIDEQHRFGVIQRAQLEEKGSSTHVLVMSATPIPRTITLTLYGQFEISIIDELPFEKEIKTYWVADSKREEVYQLVAKQLATGVQAYVVYPLVEESEELDLRAATQMKEELENSFFSEYRVGLLHGRMSDDEKKSVMAQLQSRSIDVLVSTSIIEVGIDVPDASLIVIEHANRFGLSQLHQLRGRIGRQGQKSQCFAIATTHTDEGYKRMTAFRDLLDGFAIAEQDLLIRGTGELLGVTQHGLDTTFKVADLIRDFDIMKVAKEEAKDLIEREPDSPLIEEFKKRFGDDFDLSKV